MHSKFIAIDSKNPSSAISYLLDTDKHETAEVLKGDVHLVVDIAETLDGQSYKSLIVGFSPEDQPTDEQIAELISEYEKHMFAGLDESQYTTAWVKHTKNNGHTDLHMITPCVDLESGNKLNIAPPKNLKYMDEVRDYLNEKNGWKSPNLDLHPENKATISLDPNPQFFEQKNAAMREEIQQTHLKMAAAGMLKNRADVIEHLEKSGFEISRQNKKSISIKHPDLKQNIRLKGDMYEETFDIDRTVERESEADADAKRRSIIRDFVQNPDRFDVNDANLDERTRATIEQYKQKVAERFESMEARREVRATYNRERYPSQPSRSREFNFEGNKQDADLQQNSSRNVNNNNDFQHNTNDKRSIKNEPSITQQAVSKHFTNPEHPMLKASANSVGTHKRIERTGVEVDKISERAAEQNGFINRGLERINELKEYLAELVQNMLRQREIAHMQMQENERILQEQQQQQAAEMQMQMQMKPR